MEFYFIKIGAVLMLAFITFSLSNRINKNANYYLAILFGIISLLFIVPVLGDLFFEEWFGLDIIIESIKFLIPAFLYISIYHFVNSPNHFLKKHYTLFIPSALITIVWMFLNSTEANRMFIEETYELLDIFSIIMLFIFLAIIFYLVFKMLVKHKKNILKFHANKQGVNLNWLHHLIYIFPLLFIIHVVFEANSEENYTVFFFDILLFGIFFYSGFHIVQQREIFELTLEYTQPIENKSSQKDYLKKEELIDKKLALEIANRLDKLMEEEKLFLDKNLSLALLAKKLNINTHILSYVINSHYNINFYTYINKFRIAYCKSLLKNPKKQHLSIEGIAFEGGFGSKSTFNTLFKKQIGITPSQFKKSINQ
jgi:AraC-like DNA-binding protein